MPCDELEQEGQARFISQRQYKRKIRREGPKSSTSSTIGGSVKYSTLDSKMERRVNNAANKHPTAVLVSKTTFKLRKNNYNDSDLDSAGEDSSEMVTNGGLSGISGASGAGLELMEIPLSPTHYKQPATPEHDPPTPWEAECAIHNVLSFLKVE